MKKILLTIFLLSLLVFTLLAQDFTTNRNADLSNKIRNSVNENRPIRPKLTAEERQNMPSFEERIAALREQHTTRPPQTRAIELPYWETFDGGDLYYDLGWESTYEWDFWISSWAYDDWTSLCSNFYGWGEAIWSPEIGPINGGSMLSFWWGAESDYGPWFEPWDEAVLLINWEPVYYFNSTTHNPNASYDDYWQFFEMDLSPWVGQDISICIAENYCDNIYLNVDAIEITIGGATGHLTGTVTAGGAPLSGVTVGLVGSSRSVTTNAAGVYTMNNIIEGPISITGTKHTYGDYTSPTLNIVEDQTTTHNFSMTLLPTTTVSGTLRLSDQPTSPAVGATVTLSGYEPYSVTSNASGDFNITGVFTNHTYELKVRHEGYAIHTQNVVVGTTPVNVGTITLQEKAYPVKNVVAVDNQPANATISWEEPTAGEPYWFDLSTGEIYDTIGNGGYAAMHIAHRYTPAMLEQYGIAGATLTKMAFVSRYNDGTTWTLKIWTGGAGYPRDPGPAVYEQPINMTGLLEFEWNEIELDTPFIIPTNEEFWLGFQVIQTYGYTAGCDQGPRLENYGDVMDWNGTWYTMNDAGGGSLPYNWLIKGWVEDGQGIDRSFSLSDTTPNLNPNNDSRIRTNYNVYITTRENETNPAAWTLVGSPTGETYVDNTWPNYANGFYKYAVRAVHTGGVMSDARLSNIVEIGTRVNVTGTLRLSDQPTMPAVGATITITGLEVYTGTSNASGVFSIPNVLKNETYQVKIAHTGYYTYTGTITVGEEDYDMDTIILEEKPSPVRNVVAIDNNPIANISWDAPVPGEDIWFTLSTETLQDAGGLGDGGWYETANRFDAAMLNALGVAGAAVTEFGFHAPLAASNIPSSGYEARFYAGGSSLTDLGPMVYSQAIPAATITAGAWNYITLNQEVEIPTNAELLIVLYSNHVAGQYPHAFCSGALTANYGNIRRYNNYSMNFAAGAFAGNFMIKAMASGAEGPRSFSLEEYYAAAAQTAGTG
ncbi:MAG: carboxypeptidase-like regulatory domain-containing protein, partial [Candidatus Cloacimonetes bacterium]|nr:carboxypeptidase-like regulatory domain-containing protein [Candidatus Cloacimonadota bacterium]